MPETLMYGLTATAIHKTPTHLEWACRRLNHEGNGEDQENDERDAIPRSKGSFQVVVGHTAGANVMRVKATLQVQQNLEWERIRNWNRRP
jgi:hypothetical protein